MKAKAPPGYNVTAKSGDVVWCDRGWQTAYYGFCPSEKAWRKMLGYLKLPLTTPYPQSDACVNEFIKADGKSCHVVTIAAHIDRRWRSDPVGVMALVVHECTHIHQHILDHMGERGRPSTEYEAYAMQAIFSGIMQAYLETRLQRRKSA